MRLKTLSIKLWLSKGPCLVYGNLRCCGPVKQNGVHLSPRLSLNMAEERVEPETALEMLLSLPTLYHIDMGRCFILPIP